MMLTAETSYKSREKKAAEKYSMNQPNRRNRNHMQMQPQVLQFGNLHKIIVHTDEL
jgi:hypothetical protein